MSKARSPVGCLTYPIGDVSAERADVVVGVRAYGLNRQCDAFTDEIIDIVESADPPIRWLAINAAAIGDVDFSGADSVRQIPNELVRQNAALVLCGDEHRGPEHIFDRRLTS